MANTFTQIYIHIVFSVQGRHNVISKEHKEELHKYTTGIITHKGQKLLAIHAMPDHVHILVGLKPDKSISDLVRDIKANSSRFITEKKWVRGKFRWQEGFGAFSYSHSQLTAVINYIRNQEKHHAKRTFRQEYIEMLRKFNVEHDSKYLFEWIEGG
ncbi:MAG: IS200/IS605 family transposase [Bacteroidetes bacterium]|nr:IS200/IS605 family transposase [Bacteroidota bacterium]MCW5896038.1 IS200/IS605 family transposase [Bacteroidota bacterium]